MTQVNKKNNKKGSPLKKIGSFISCLIMIGMCIFFFTQINKEVKTTISLTSSLNESKKELAELEAEKELLIAQKEKLTDKNYISSVARGKYLITKDNEQIYVLPSLDD